MYHRLEYTNNFLDFCKMDSSYIIGDDCGHNQASYNCKLSDIINHLNDVRRWVRPIAGKISLKTAICDIFSSKFAW